MALAPVILVLGAGKNIGLNVARIFSQHGYKVALVARSPSNDLSASADLTIEEDLSNPSVVSKVFREVISKLGHPSVVVYNASVVLPTPAEEPFARSVSDIQTNMNINYFSAYAAAQNAIESFKAAPQDVKTTFIFTGNILNVKPLPGLLGFGASKSASAHMIASASQAYAEMGFRFYYVDERVADGSAVGQQLSGAEHAKEFWHLAELSSQGPWLWTFVRDKGYVNFGNQGYIQ